MKAGILGGGQLGRMLLQAAANYTVETFVLENDAACPAAHLCHHFVLGDIKDYETVLAFGRQVNVLTIEIEAVNTDALEQLQKEGITVIPSPAAIKTIRNKIKQKTFYSEASIPTAPFRITQNKTELKQHIDLLPAAHKIGEGGYDGKGVEIIEDEKDIDRGFDAPAVLEKKINIKKEVALIVAKSQKGDIVIYPPVEMVFDPVLNLLDYQLCPVELPEQVLWKAEAIAQAVVNGLGGAGLFAVELFIDIENNVWVNETAPRVHNSGHHTIEAHFSSQYDMLWRILLNYPLGNADKIISSAIVNLLGAKGHSGPAYYDGLDEVLQMDNVFVHLYGKSHTKPGRKMGHVTILSNDRQDLTHKANKIKHKLRIITKPDSQ